MYYTVCNDHPRFFRRCALRNFVSPHLLHTKQLSTPVRPKRLITAAAATIAEFVFDHLHLVPRGQFQFRIQVRPWGDIHNPLHPHQRKEVHGLSHKKVDLPWAWALSSSPTQRKTKLNGNQRIRHISSCVSRQPHHHQYTDVAEGVSPGGPFGLQGTKCVSVFPTYIPAIMKCTAHRIRLPSTGQV